MFLLLDVDACLHFMYLLVSTSHFDHEIHLQVDVTRTMIDDHLISFGYRRIFLNLMRDFTQDDHFSFEGQRDS